MEPEAAITQLKQLGIYVSESSDHLGISGAERGRPDTLGGGGIFIIYGWRFSITADNSGWNVRMSCPYIPGHAPCQQTVQTLEEAVGVVSGFFVKRRTFGDGITDAQTALKLLRAKHLIARFSRSNQGSLDGGISLPIQEDGPFQDWFSIYRKGNYYIALRDGHLFHTVLLTFTQSLRAAIETVCDSYDTR